MIQLKSTICPANTSPYVAMKMEKKNKVLLLVRKGLIIATSVSCPYMVG